MVGDVFWLLFGFVLILVVQRAARKDAHKLSEEGSWLSAVLTCTQLQSGSLDTRRAEGWQVPRGLC